MIKLRALIAFSRILRLCNSGKVNYRNAKLCAKITDSLCIIACCGNVSLGACVVIIGCGSYDRCAKNRCCAGVKSKLYLIVIEIVAEGAFICISL